jgi:hypothetical protein
MSLKSGEEESDSPQNSIGEARGAFLKRGQGVIAVREFAFTEWIDQSPEVGT